MSSRTLQQRVTIFHFHPELRYLSRSPILSNRKGQCDDLNRCHGCGRRAMAPSRALPALMQSAKQQKEAEEREAKSLRCCSCCCCRDTNKAFQRSATEGQRASLWKKVCARGKKRKQEGSHERFKTSRAASPVQSLQLIGTPNIIIRHYSSMSEYESSSSSGEDDTTAPPAPPHDDQQQKKPNQNSSSSP